MSVGVGTSGPFRGFVAFDEASADTFYGREPETTRLANLVLAEGARTVALSGEAGVGKTSLLRAGLIPAVQKRGGLAIYLCDYHDLDAEILRATGRLGVDLPAGRARHARSTGRAAGAPRSPVTRGHGAGARPARGGARRRRASQRGCDADRARHRGRRRAPAAGAGRRRGRGPTLAAAPRRDRRGRHGDDLDEPRAPRHRADHGDPRADRAAVGDILRDRTVRGRRR